MLYKVACSVARSKSPQPYIAHFHTEGNNSSPVRNYGNCSLYSFNNSTIIYSLNLPSLAPSRRNIISISLYTTGNNSSQVRNYEIRSFYSFNDSLLFIRLIFRRFAPSQRNLKSKYYYFLSTFVS